MLQRYSIPAADRQGKDKEADCAECMHYKHCAELIGICICENNVSLSAMASNKQIKGYSTIPTDTVLILDLSGSMRSADDSRGSAIDELVEATNKAITDLLALNSNNRVSVVIYAGNVANSDDETMKARFESSTSSHFEPSVQNERYYYTQSLW